MVVASSRTFGTKFDAFCSRVARAISSRSRVARSRASRSRARPAIFFLPLAFALIFDLGRDDCDVESGVLFSFTFLCSFVVRFFVFTVVPFVFAFVFAFVVPRARRANATNAANAATATATATAIT